MRLLENGGRLAIVLPDTYLFSESYGWLIEWLSRFTITHSINVPIEAFEPHCRAKTSILVIRKATPSKTHQIIGSVCETYGEDKHGRARYNIVDGAETATLDDEMSEAAKLFRVTKGKHTETKLRFEFPQAEAMKQGVLVASFWWRKPYLDALKDFAKTYDCELVSVGDLIDAGDLAVFEGHGSPKSHFKGKGSVPYIKVVDIKNWRVIENPSYFMPQVVAAQYTAKRPLKPYDLGGLLRCPM
jgi:type I restriction enzyme M protein